MNLILLFLKLYPDSVSPTRRPGDAGWDLCLHHSAINPNSTAFMMHTGIAVQIPDGYFGLLRPRSSLSNMQYVFCSSGVIDPSYRGELIVPLRDVGDGQSYFKGDRIAQLLILPLPPVRFVQVPALSDTERGAGGFGSTGT